MGRVNYGGLVIAGIGFFATRFTVTLALYEDPLRFYLAGVVPLLLGLGLAAFGVALAVADVEASLVRTTAAWCVAGTGAMLVLVLLTLLGSATGDLSDPATVRSQAYLSNFLVGGSVGGTLTGLYATRNRRHREEIRRQANRLEVLNRLLRHEVLNAVGVIRAAVDLGGTETEERIVERSVAIERAIDQVTYLARSTRASGHREATVDLRDCLEASVATVTEEHPDAAVSIGPFPAVSVHATDRLEGVFVHLLENAIVHGGDASPEIEVSTVDGNVRASVRDDGPGLPETQRALLETGEIQPFDDPGAGFGLNVVRLLVEDFGGTIEVDATAGTTITVVLRRADVEGAARRPLPSNVAGVRPAVPHLVVTLGAATVAGVAYGLVSELLGGSVAGIGVFYGAPSPVVGWLTHEFHSVVFGFVFAGLVSLAPARYRNDLLPHVAIGVGWALTLWVLAAGVVAPVWLRLLGIAAPIPNFSPTLLASHLAWGVSLGALTAWGYTHVVPWLARRLD